MQITLGRDDDDVLVAICGRDGAGEQPLEGEQLLVVHLLALASDLHVFSGEESRLCVAIISQKDFRIYVDYNNHTI